MRFLNYFLMTYFVTVSHIVLFLVFLSGSMYFNTARANSAMEDFQQIYQSKLRKTDHIAAESIFTAERAEKVFNNAVIKLAKSNNYEFILFYRAACPHCQRFDPILKSYSLASGIRVKAFTFGGVLPSFPKSVRVNQGLVQQYFGTTDIAVPTLFILNQKTMQAFPVSRGELSYLDLVERMNGLAAKIITYERNKKNERDEKRSRSDV